MGVGVDGDDGNHCHRILELRQLPARELEPNPGKRRPHPARQAAALRSVLEEVGYADAFLARELPDGRLMLVDGHLRAETTPDQLVPVLVLESTSPQPTSDSRRSTRGQPWLTPTSSRSST